MCYICDTSDHGYFVYWQARPMMNTDFLPTIASDKKIFNEYVIFRHLQENQIASDLSFHIYFGEKILHPYQNSKRLCNVLGAV